MWDVYHNSFSLSFLAYHRLSPEGQASIHVGLDEQKVYYGLYFQAYIGSRHVVQGIKSDVEFQFVTISH